MTVDEIIDRLLEQMIQPDQPTKAILTYGPAIPIANKKKEEEEEEGEPKKLPWSNKGNDFVQDCKIREDTITRYLKKLYFDD